MVLRRFPVVVSLELNRQIYDPHYAPDRTNKCVQLSLLQKQSLHSPF